jgi:hypothetical protein
MTARALCSAIFLFSLVNSSRATFLRWFSRDDRQPWVPPRATLAGVVNDDRPPQPTTTSGPTIEALQERQGYTNTCGYISGKACESSTFATHNLSEPVRNRTYTSSQPYPKHASTVPYANTIPSTMLQAAVLPSLALYLPSAMTIPHTQEAHAWPEQPGPGVGKRWPLHTGHTQNTGWSSG